MSTDPLEWLLARALEQEQNQQASAGPGYLQRWGRHDRDLGQLLFVTSARSISIFSSGGKNAAILGKTKEINRKESAWILAMEAEAKGNLVTRLWFLLGQ